MSEAFKKNIKLILLAFIERTKFNKIFNNNDYVSEAN